MNIIPIVVRPKLPEALKPLEKIARNLWFAWHPDAIRLFQRMDRDKWETVNHNPVELLGQLDQNRIDELTSDEGFLDHLDRVTRAFERYVSDNRKYSFQLSTPAEYTIAYFSAEYGLTECLPIYSGGLGVLSGDHLKSASDIRIPLVGVGLLYKEGYFHQYLNADSWQQERYPENEFESMPLDQMRNDDGSPVTVEVELEDEMVKLYIWRVNVGRVSLYLLDSNVPENSQAARTVTGQLYGGDREMRLRQEIVLGIGGVRALRRLGIQPSVLHMNEGHSAFASLERMRFLMTEKGLDFAEAVELVRASNVFTTHTPVPAGNDSFSPELINTYMKNFVKSLGISWEKFMTFGRLDPDDLKEHFGMTVLALKFSALCNGVSVLHDRVSRDMWKSLWPTLPVADVPIAPLTNGIHVPSWISNEMGLLYDRYLGPRWTEDPDNEKVWERVNEIPDTELWRTHVRRRERLVAFARRRLEMQLRRSGAPLPDIEAARGVLHPEALTIGFARRFATYKRAVLFLTDPDRLERILCNKDRPVQLIISGKAHPADEHGKEFIRKIVQYSKEPRFRNRIVFIEDYDMNIARYLVQGVDVWLNNPRRPLEACGTSGMKAAANGALNLSILDGWWDEAYDGQNGWAIGRGEEYEDEEYQDALEARTLYELLENELVPTFYNRALDGLPKLWIEKMRHCLMTVCPVFNTHRMVEDYMCRFYDRAARLANRLRADDYSALKALAKWKTQVETAWPGVEIERSSISPENGIDVHGKVKVKADVRLNGLSPQDVRVSAYVGRLNLRDKIESGGEIELAPSSGTPQGGAIYEGDVPCDVTGKFGVAIKVVPNNELLANPDHLNLVKWS